MGSSIDEKSEQERKFVILRLIRYIDQAKHT